MNSRKTLLIRDLIFPSRDQSSEFQGTEIVTCGFPLYLQSSATLPLENDAH